MEDTGTPEQSFASSMVWVPGGSFIVGSNEHYPEEAPARPAEVDGFWIDAEPVSNASFARFVAETGHVTSAEIAPSPLEFPSVDPALLQAGSLVFVAPEYPVSPDDPSAWWRYVGGADWRHPLGPDSSLINLEKHPVVHVSHADAKAYAKWAGKQLPSEAQWEWAAWGGAPRARYVWGSDLVPAGEHQANIWQGTFPHHKSGEDGYMGTSPIGAFPPNKLGLFDMIGNVWEWTEDRWRPHHPMPASKPCCITRNPRAPAVVHAEQTDQRVIKGGSFLCAPNYCQRYRPAARQAHLTDSGTSHIGFRCVQENSDFR